jgi:uncharacterized protein YndB with AHSA1/START domain
MRGERHARGARSAGSKKGRVGWRNVRHSAECRLHKVNRNTRLEITYLMTEAPSANPMDGIYNHPGNPLHPLRLYQLDIPVGYTSWWVIGITSGIPFGSFGLPG